MHGYDVVFTDGTTAPGGTWYSKRNMFAHWNLVLEHSESGEGGPTTYICPQPQPRPNPAPSPYTQR